MVRKTDAINIERDRRSDQHARTPDAPKPTERE
jgi:hypothetical protein